MRVQTKSRLQIQMKTRRPLWPAKLLRQELWWEIGRSILYALLAPAKLKRQVAPEKYEEIDTHPRWPHGY